MKLARGIQEDQQNLLLISEYLCVTLKLSLFPTIHPSLSVIKYSSPSFFLSFTWGTRSIIPSEVEVIFRLSDPNQIRLKMYSFVVCFLLLEQPSIVGESHPTPTTTLLVDSRLQKTLFFKSKNLIVFNVRILLKTIYLCSKFGRHQRKDGYECINRFNVRGWRIEWC